MKSANRFVFKAALILTIILSVFACTKTGGKKGEKGGKGLWTIGMSQCNLGEPWRVQMNADIKKAAALADPDWAGEGSLSQVAVRAVRSTAGVTSVLVGMRRTAYVDDVLEELQRTVLVKERTNSWEAL